MRPLVILCVLFQAILPVRGADSPNAEQAARFHELEVARQTAEDRCLELNARLVRTEKELDQARKQLADALLETKRLRGDLQAIKLKAANVLVNHQDLSEARVLAQVHVNLRELGSAHQQLYRYLLDYKQSLESVLDVLDSGNNSSLRQLLQRQLELIFYQFGEAQSIADTTAANDNGTNALTSTVLNVNENLAVVVLDAGRMQGIRIGSSWQVTNNRGSKTVLRIVEARHSLSAALVVEGNLNQVTPGATAHLIIQPGE